jgi:threonine dehydratase
VAELGSGDGVHDVVQIVGTLALHGDPAVQRVLVVVVRPGDPGGEADQPHVDRDAVGDGRRPRDGSGVVREVGVGEVAALELLDEAGELDLLLVPVGGGGLIAGSATAAKGVRPGIRVVGVEPEAGDDTRRSLAAGRRVSVPVPRTIADGQAAAVPGELTFAVNRRLVDDIVLVGDDDIVDAMRFAFERMKLVAEPSGATPIAALLAGRLSPPARVGLIVSGGNIGAQRFSELMTSPPRRG